jgi:serine/threonine protein kinase
VNGERDEVLGRLGEELAAAVAAGESIVVAAWAERFAVDPGDVAACLRAVQALELGLGEELVEGPPELPAPRLPDDYELVGEVGRGGMGVVYRAHQRSLGRDVAIKVLRPGDLVFGDALRRFRTEARSLARLRHRHIVSVHDLGESEDGTLWFAMDLIDGCTLADELARTRRFLPSRAVRTMRQVGSAIVHAHAHGIVHRDLKPQNVLLDAQGDAYVVDFGLARDTAAAAARTLTGELLGTPAYMSPEQADGHGSGIGEASDVWALGAMLYELLTGRGPFSGKPLHETIRAILEDEPVAPRRLDARIPQGLEAICLKALRKRPEDRYPTALAFVEDLERFADGRSVQARPPSRWSRAWSALRRRGTSIAAAAVAVVTTLSVVQSWLPSLQQQELFAAAERLRADGHPSAAIAALQDLQQRYPLGGDDHHRRELLLARCHNDFAAERSFAGDRSAATAAAQQALRHAEPYDRTSGILLGDEFTDYVAFQWELARARWFLPPPSSPTRELDWSNLVPHAQADLRSAVPSRIVLAGLVASRARVALPGLADDERGAVVDAFVQACGNRLAAGDRDALTTFPWTWHAIDHDTWWSPAAEAKLAELAARSDLPATARAVAGRALCVTSGLPSNATLADLPGADAGAPTAATVAAAAPALVAAWRQWQGQPLEDRLRARIDLLVSAVQQPGQLLPGAEAQVAATLQRWLGLAPPAPRDLGGWWAALRRRPFDSVLCEGLQLRDDTTIGVAAALDRSATADAAAMLWRQRAWLQLPATAQVPMADAATTEGGVAWRQHTLAAAGLTEPERFFVRAAVLRFDDGSPQPHLVDQVVLPAHLGVAVHATLRTHLADTPWVSMRRRIGEDEDQRTDHLLRLKLSTMAELPAEPRFGECAAELRGCLVVDREGVRLEGRGWVRARLANRIGSTWGLAAARRVWVGSAASFDGVTQAWDGGQRLSTFLLLAQVGEGTDPPPWALEDWRRAVVDGLQDTARASAGTLRGRSTDWLTPAWWPMPEVASELRRLAEPVWQAPLTPDWHAALALAGVELPLSARPLPDAREVPGTRSLRVVVGTPNPAVREAELAQLTRHSFTWRPAIAANLQQAATTTGFVLPPALQTEVDAQLGWSAKLGAAWRSDYRPLAALLVWLVGILVGFPRSKDRATALAWLATWVLFAGIGLRLQFAGVVLTPTFVPLLLAMAIAAAGAPPDWRAWRWYRWVGLAVFTLEAAMSAIAWFGIAPMPVFGFGALVATWLLTRTERENQVHQRPRQRGRAR